SAGAWPRPKLLDFRFHARNRCRDSTHDGAPVGRRLAISVSSTGCGLAATGGGLCVRAQSPRRSASPDTAAFGTASETERKSEKLLILADHFSTIRISLHHLHLDPMDPQLLDCSAASSLSGDGRLDYVRICVRNSVNASGGLCGRSHNAARPHGCDHQPCVCTYRHTSATPVGL